MLFSSIPFLFYFLPCVLLLYALSPRKLKNFTLLVCSLVFYAWGEPRLVLLMLITVFIGYILGLLTEKFPRFKKLFVIVAVAFCLGFLAYYKYVDFFITNFNAVTGLSLPLLRVTLPIGISFYTFQLLSYNVDVYRGSVPAQRSFIDLAAYISMFPQLIAGPIVRYSDVAAQLRDRSYSAEKFASGTRRFIIGLSKKILIANALGELCDIFRASGDKSVLFYWMYAIAFALHIYFDFSGYSDMAIGLGKLLGFDFIENFNYPYISKSVTEFWRRWHISLGSWFRDYVYFPMGGSRVPRPRMFLNIFVVWMLTGFWHGADWNFIIWGLYFAVLLVIEKVFLMKFLKKSRIIGRIYVLFAVLISWIIFNATSMGEAFSYIGGLFGAGGIPLVSAEAVYYLQSFGLIAAIAVIGATPIPKQLAGKVKILQYVEPVFLLGLLAIITGYLVDGSFNPFLYFRF
ncbi:MAG: MBOAT family protein [Clostridia bacterium]|nr:MBOAT family protein [Clostridia bacterium]